MESTTVLYIDDNADTQSMKSRFELIEDEGFMVIPVVHADEVMPTIEKNASTIDIIVLDMLIPPEDHYTLEETNYGTATGLRILRDIRGRLPDIPVIIVSVKQRRRTPQDLLESYKVADYLEKPVLPSEIVATIRNVLGGKKR